MGAYSKVGAFSNKYGIHCTRVIQIQWNPDFSNQNVFHLDSISVNTTFSLSNSRFTVSLRDLKNRDSTVNALQCIYSICLGCLFVLYPQRRYYMRLVFISL